MPITRSQKKNFSIQRIVKQTLEEDRADHDVTTRTLIPKGQRNKAYIKFNEPAIICGLDFAKTTFKLIDKNVTFRSSFKDGDRVKKGTKVAQLEGSTRAILSGERVALNFLGYLSGVATLTNLFVKKVRPFKTKILDTRKTTPGLRALEKYAVRCGGGINHRADLSEMILIKDNHRAAQGRKRNGTLQTMITKAKKTVRKPFEIEVENLKEFREALAAKPDFILLDNMKPQLMKKAVRLRNAEQRKKGSKNIYLEASGGIDLKNIRKIAQTGVDRISVGAITHSAQSVDVSMELTG